jgi:hypothetical protein
LWVFQGFNEFLEHLGPRPSPQHSVDRISRTGSYALGNVRWASPQEQANNRSTSRSLRIGAETLNVEQWAERAGVPATTIRSRLHRGWSDYEAVHGKGAIDPSPPTPQDPSLIPAPPGWEAPVMKNGRPLPYVPRLDPKYADRFEFPLDGWPWPEDVCDHTERAFQFERKAGHRRIDHLLFQLGVYITRIEQHCDAYLGRVQTITLSRRERYILLPAPLPGTVKVSKPASCGDERQGDLFLKPKPVSPVPYDPARSPIRARTARPSYVPEAQETEVAGGILRKLQELEQHLQNDPETGEPYWAHPTRSPEECESRHQKLTALLEKALARKSELLAPFRALRAEARYRIDDACLPGFWRAVATAALSVPVRRPDADQGAW